MLGTDWFCFTTVHGNPCSYSLQFSFKHKEADVLKHQTKLTLKSFVLQILCGSVGMLWEAIYVYCIGGNFAWIKFLLFFLLTPFLQKFNPREKVS